MSLLGEGTNSVEVREEVWTCLSHWTTDPLRPRREVSEQGPFVDKMETLLPQRRNRDVPTAEDGRRSKGFDTVKREGHATVRTRNDRR